MRIWKIEYPKGPKTPGSPTHMNHDTLGFCGMSYHLGNLNLFVYNLEHKGIPYPKGPGTPGPPNHVNYYILSFGGLDFHLGELDLFVYH